METKDKTPPWFARSHFAHRGATNDSLIKVATLLREDEGKKTKKNAPISTKLCSASMTSFAMVDYPGGVLVAGDRWRFGCFREHFGRGTGRGAGVNERQMRVVPTQLFSQSRSKARRTGRSTGNLRWVLPLFAVARRPAEGWKCLQWGTTSKPFPI